MKFSFTSKTIEWRGPAPYLFAPIPEDISREIKEISTLVTYGWGVIPCTLTIGSTTVTTSLFPKDGSYLLPIKVAISRAEKIEIGHVITAKILIDLPSKFR